ncbi:MAG: hypothetical protein KGJ55_03995 [Gammaproteobacteria bacterium]|nr:hypothetical protein [Gammaproteobacteria bacterium]
MANNPRAFDPRAREAQQRAYLAVPTLAEQFPGVDEVSVELRFMLPGGQPHSSPHKRIFLPDMQAFFGIQCPDRDCSGGGFDLGSAIKAAARSKRRGASGSLQCQGVKAGDPCSVSLNYSVAIRRGGAG